MLYTKKVNNVYETNDYSKFGKLKGNRPTREDEKLKKDLQENGQLVPIIVNKFYEIMDGQNRFRQLKELGMPIQYIVSEKSVANNVVSINNTQNGWLLEDYLNFHAEQGNEEYKKAKSFYLSHSLLISTVIIGGMGFRHGTSSKVLRLFRERDGSTYKFKNEKQLSDFANFYKRFLNEVKMPNEPALEKALWTLYTTEAFNEDRMIEKSISCSVKITLSKAMSIPIYLDALLNAHNFSLQKNSKFYIKHYRDSANSLVFE